MNTLPELPLHTILQVEVGSTSHGTGTPGGEDLDLLVVYIEPIDKVIGVHRPSKIKMRRTQPEGTRSGPGDIDRTEYPLRKFLELAQAGNPSIMMALWAPLHGDATTPAGHDLRDISEAFVGRHIIDRYRGYMRSQVMRILGLKGNGHGRRGGGGREELIAEHGFDTKFAMHAARLGFQCAELLETGKLTFPITAAHGGEWLRSLRAGKVSFDEWWDVVLMLDAELALLKNRTSIRWDPDFAVINDFSIFAHLDAWNAQIRP